MVSSERGLTISNIFRPFSVIRYFWVGLCGLYCPRLLAFSQNINLFRNQLKLGACLAPTWSLLGPCLVLTLAATLAQRVPAAAFFGSFLMN